MNDYRYVKTVEDDVEEYKRLIETHVRFQMYT